VSTLRFLFLVLNFDVLGSVSLIEILRDRKGNNVGRNILLLPTMFKMRVRTNLSAVCVIYSYAISAYNNLI